MQGLLIDPVVTLTPARAVMPLDRFCDLDLARNDVRQFPIAESPSFNASRGHEITFFSLVR
jgi:hypothetical protein